MNDFLIDTLKQYSEGGSAEFYYLKNYPNLGFKQFRSKKCAIQAFDRQTTLSAFDLAPRIHSNIRKLNTSGWGFITEKAIICNDTLMSKRLKQIQELVDSIYQKTGWKFWDCHYYNIGYIKRHKKKKLVCIDTGDESFKADANAWGNPDAGPKCSYCLTYNCQCEE